MIAATVAWDNALSLTYQQAIVALQTTMEQVPLMPDFFPFPESHSKFHFCSLIFMPIMDCKGVLLKVLMGSFYYS